MARRSGEPAAYRAVVKLYTGDLLPEDRYEDWAQERREGLRLSCLSLLVEMAGLYEERGGVGAAIEAFGEAGRSAPRTRWRTGRGPICAWATATTSSSRTGGTKVSATAR